jgi:transcriptional regulator with XRE-family HTH domain
MSRNRNAIQTEFEFACLVKAFYYLRDIEEIPLAALAAVAGCHEGTLNQYRCRSREAPPAIREKLVALANVYNCDIVGIVQRVSKAEQPSTDFV